jgi:HAMP domain-containing protein
VPKQFAKRTLAAMARNMGNVATALASNQPEAQPTMPIALAGIVDARNALQLAEIGLANEDPGLLSIASDRLKTDLGKVYSPSSADRER